MPPAQGPFVGIDVGGRRKGFHLAAVDDELHVVLGQVPDPADAAAWIDRHAPAPTLVGIDSPAAWAEPGDRSRACERAFARRGICGIRFTPDRAEALGNPYYEWVEHGLELWDTLRGRGLAVAECFPTASWTQWLGPRAGRSRGAWSRAGIGRLGDAGVRGLDRAGNQDLRDAVAAALTARQHASADGTEVIGELVVPVAGSWPI